MTDTNVFTDYGRARDYMARRNVATIRAGGRKSSQVVVLVTGPDETEYWVMPISDAIEGGFCYEWSV